jgi:hypothetical protein
MKLTIEEIPDPRKHPSPCVSAAVGHATLPSCLPMVLRQLGERSRCAANARTTRAFWMGATAEEF